MAEGADTTIRVNIRTSAELVAYLDDLVRIGIHGKSRSDVARTLVANEVERLIREKVLKLRDNSSGE